MYHHFKVFIILITKVNEYKLFYGLYGQFPILFAETLKTKINIHFLFYNIHLLHSLSFEKIVPIPNI